ncbi:uncharacterized protein LOC134717672 [Mytilus trossulus]|uniref:uncharacterized protein LOC134717672 n=1 Tax=Mytilus trossulus TaxID=6551 RepID=UPI003004383C
MSLCRFAHYQERSTSDSVDLPKMNKLILLALVVVALECASAYKNPYRRRYLPRSKLGLRYSKKLPVKYVPIVKHVPVYKTVPKYIPRYIRVPVIQKIKVPHTVIKKVPVYNTIVKYVPKAVKVYVPKEKIVEVPVHHHTEKVIEVPVPGPAIHHKPDVIVAGGDNIQIGGGNDFGFDGAWGNDFQFNGGVGKILLRTDALRIIIINIGQTSLL